MRLPAFNLLDYDIFPNEKLRADLPWAEPYYSAEERHPFFTAPIPVKFSDSRLTPDLIVVGFILLIFASVLAARSFT